MIQLTPDSPLKRSSTSFIGRAPQGMAAADVGVRSMGLLLYYSAVGEVQALRHALEAGVGVSRGESASPGQVLADSASESLCRRFRFWGFLLGRVGDTTLTSVEEAARGFVGRGRVDIQFEGLAPETTVPEQLVSILSLAILLAGEGLPRGGVVRIGGDPGAGYTLVLEGPLVGWRYSVISAFEGGELPEEPASRELIAVCLAAAAGAADVVVSIDMDQQAGSPRLRVALPLSLRAKPPTVPGDTAEVPAAVSADASETAPGAR